MGQVGPGAGFGQPHEMLQLKVVVSFRRFLCREPARLLTVTQIGDSGFRLGRGSKSHYISNVQLYAHLDQSSWLNGFEHCAYSRHQRSQVMHPIGGGD